MYNRDTVNEFVSLFNFLVAEATSAAARARFLAKAAGALPADMPSVRDRAGLTRVCVDKVTARGGETRLFADQLYRLFREANTAWGRCLTVRRKTLAALRKELLAAAEGGNLDGLRSYRSCWRSWQETRLRRCRRSSTRRSRWCGRTAPPPTVKRKSMRTTSRGNKNPHTARCEGFF